MQHRSVQPRDDSRGLESSGTGGLPRAPTAVINSPITNSHHSNAVR